MLNEHSLNKSLLRFALIAMTLLIAIVLGLVLRWVLVQLFVAIIIAASMAPLVSALTHPERTRNWRWRPPRALVVLVIYALACFIVLAGAALLVRVLTLEGQVLVDRVPEYADAAQAWIDAQGQTNPFLQALGLGSFSIGLVGLEQYVLTVLRQLHRRSHVAVLALWRRSHRAVRPVYGAVPDGRSRKRMLEYLLVFAPDGREDRSVG